MKIQLNFDYYYFFQKCVFTKKVKIYLFLKYSIKYDQIHFFGLFLEQLFQIHDDGYFIAMNKKEKLD